MTKNEPTLRINLVEELATKMVDIISHPESAASALYYSGCILRRYGTKDLFIDVIKRALKRSGTVNTNKIVITCPNWITKLERSKLSWEVKGEDAPQMFSRVQRKRKWYVKKKLDIEIKYEDIKYESSNDDIQGESKRQGLAHRQVQSRRRKTKRSLSR